MFKDFSDDSCRDSEEECPRLKELFRRRDNHEDSDSDEEEVVEEEEEEEEAQPEPPKPEDPISKTVAELLPIIMFHKRNGVSLYDVLMRTYDLSDSDEDSVVASLKEFSDGDVQSDESSFLLPPSTFAEDETDESKDGAEDEHLKDIDTNANTEFKNQIPRSDASDAQTSSPRSSRKVKHEEYRTSFKGCLSLADITPPSIKRMRVSSDEGVCS